MKRRLLLVALGPLVIAPAVLAACSGATGVRATGADTRGDTAGAARGARVAVPSPDPVDSLPSDGPVARYRGAFARETAVLAFQREAGLLLDAAVARLRDETGLQFTEGRAPAITLLDSPDLPAGGRASLRLVNGVRRPQIDVRASAVVAGEFRAKEHLPALVAESAVLAASAERAAPEWVVRGLPTVFSDGAERRASELLLGGATARVDLAGLAPLEPAFRVAALQRIGVGERVLARFLDARLGGAGDAAALREVGVGSMDFLDAAAATEADRMLDRILEDERARSLRAVRESLTAGDIAAAESAISRVPASGGASPWVDAEVRLVRAETSLLRGEDGAAIASLDDVLARPEFVLRLRDARFLRALAALKADDPGARARAAEFARTCIDDPRTAAILQDLGVSTQDAFDLVSGDTDARAKSAARLGEKGIATTLPFVARSLRDGEASVRRAVVAAIGRIGAKSGAVELDTACGDSDAGVRSAALVALAQIDAPRGLTRSREMTSDPDESVRRAAADVIARLAPKPVAEPRAAVAKPSVPNSPKPKDAPTAVPDPSRAPAALTPPDDLPPPLAPRGKPAGVASPTPSPPSPPSPTPPTPTAPAAGPKAPRPTEGVKVVSPPAPTPPAAPPTPGTPPRRTDPPPRPAAPTAKPPAPVQPPPAPVAPAPVPPKTPTPLPPPTPPAREKV
ncbi:MAG: HEAT repeat domain-containing protein [Planctomycetes bacterium]|nr:HEAT repeat domain-containing protein [Planctomycetota bacterium]